MRESTRIFDTLSYAKKLQGAGFTAAQAEIQAETFLTIVEDHLVDKRDLKELEASLKQDMAVVNRDIKILEMEFKRDMKALEVSLTQQLELIRRDIKEMELSTKKDLELLRRDMEVMRRDLKIWLGSGLIVAVSVLGGLMKFLVH